MSGLMNRDRRIFITCYFASGAAALVYQVAWTRLFLLQLGHTTAASSTVLAAFMGGMAAGAWVGGNVRSDSGRRLLKLYAAIELFIGVVAVVLPGALRALVPALAWAYADGTAPTFFAMLRVAISLFLVGVPAAAMGATFPIAVAWLAACGAHAPGIASCARHSGRRSLRCQYSRRRHRRDKCWILVDSGCRLARYDLDWHCVEYRGCGRSFLARRRRQTDRPVREPAARPRRAGRAHPLRRAAPSAPCRAQRARVRGRRPLRISRARV